MTRNHSAVGTERESATSKRLRSDEASKAMAQDRTCDIQKAWKLERPKRVDPNKTDH